MEGKYARLFEKVRVGRLHLRNRIVMSPMQTRFLEGVARDATFTYWYTEYFRERARGGVGFIITGHIKAEKEIDPYPLRSVFPVLDCEERVKEFAHLTETVHRYGAKIAAQLSAGTGRLADVYDPNRWPAAPSPLPSLYFPQLMTRELQKGEIARLVEAYGRAAHRVKRAGFDALYVHGLAFLIDQFISSCWNQRKDEYGGSLDNRLRFLKECIECARYFVGKDFPVIVGLALEHGFDGGRKLDETIEIAKEIERLDIDAFHVRNGSYERIDLLIPNAMHKDGEVLENAAIFKKEIRTPIIVDGKLGDPDLCLQAITDGKADLVGIARQLLADPEWPNKVRRGRIDEIRPCIGCMECFDRTAQRSMFVACSVNARLGHERELPPLPVKVSKRVLIIGGGPAGMEAARIAASRGHRVTIVEKRERLGGRLIEASAPDYKSPIGKFNLWLQREMMKSGCDVIMGKEADEGLINEVSPDVIIVACGAKEKVPDVPGIRGKNVFMAVDVLRNQVQVGEKVAVLGGGPVGCDTAYKLARDGKRVIIAEELPLILHGVSVYNRIPLMKILDSLGIVVHVNTSLKEIKDNGILCLKEGREIFIDADSVVVATGFEVEEDVLERFRGLADDVYCIGDAVEARKIYDAIQEGYLIGREI